MFIYRGTDLFVGSKKLRNGDILQDKEYNEIIAKFPFIAYFCEKQTRTKTKKSQK